MAKILRRREVRQRVWKGLNLIVAITTILNVSAIGAFIAPRVAQAASIGSYDQCSNDQGNGYSSGDTGCRWVNGNLQSSNSLYAEGDSTVQRVWLDGFVPGSTHSVTLQYGTTKQGKHAYDYLTTWSWSENWITEADLCQDIDGCATADASENTLAIPHDPNGSGQFETGTRNFVMRGGSLTNASIPAIVSGDYTSDSETAITVDFTVGNSGDMCVTKGGNTTCGVALFFGAHVAKTSLWQPFNGTTGATSIPGSPYHVALAELDGSSVGQRDNQMQAGAIANVVIEKQTLPDGSQQSFGFTSQTAALNNFSLSDGQQKLASLAGGTYSVTEGTTNGWSLGTITCTDPTSNSSGDVGTRTATINVAAGETVSCVFTNSEAATLTVTKVVNNNHGGTAQASNFPLKVDQTTVTSGATNSFSTGAHTVSETQQPGYTQVSISGDCDTNGNVTLANGDHKTCTITNEDIAPTLKLVKVVDNQNVGNASAGDWNLSATGNGGFTDAGNSTTFHTVMAGVGYDLSEADGPTGYSAGTWSCNGGNLNGSTVTLGLDQHVTCTITNTRDTGTIELKKVWVGTSGTTTLNIGSTVGGHEIDQQEVTGNGTTGANTVGTGTYYVSETGGLANYDPSLSCHAGEAILQVGQDGSVHVGKGQTVVCIYTNTRQQGDVSFLKVIDNQQNGDLSQFTFHANGNAYHSGDSDMFDTGTYGVTEDAVDGYTFVGVEGICSLNQDHNIVMNVTTEGGTCVIHNTRDMGTIELTKHWVGTPGITFLNIGTQAGGFDTANTLVFLDDGTTTQLPVTTGTYYVSEDTSFLSNYGSSLVCWDNGQEITPGQDGSVSVMKDHNVLCTYTNTRDQGALTVFKDVDTDGDGIVDVHGATDWSWNIANGEQGIATGDSRTLDTGPYVINENQKAGYHVTNLTCNGQDLGATESAQINLPVDGMTCTFTNTVNTGTLKVIKYFFDRGLPDEGPTRVNPEGWTWDVQNGPQDNPGGSTLTVVPKEYVVSEDAIPNYSSSWQCYQWLHDGEEVFKSFIDSGVGTQFDVHVQADQEVECIFTNAALPDLTISKTDNHITAQPGETLTYQVTVTNNGGGIAYGVHVDDTLPNFISSVTNISDGGILSSGRINWDLLPILGHSSKTLTYDATINSVMPIGTSILHNQADLGCSPRIEEVALLDQVCQYVGQATDDTSVTAVVNIGLDKTGPATVSSGSQLTYTLAWSVGGNTEATNAIITDPIPAGTTFVSQACGTTVGTCTPSFGSGTATWNLGTRHPGESGTVTLTVTAPVVTTPTTLVNTGTFDTDQTPPVSDTVQTPVSFVLAALSPNLSITKSVNATVINPDKSLTYTLVVKSTGDGPADNVVVTDTLPAGFAYADGGGSTKTWNLGTMAAGSQQTITYDVHVASTVKAGNYVNTATVKADDVDPLSANATVQVIVPQVLGLATTGVGLRDYLIFAIGMLLLSAGFVLLKRHRRELGLES